MSEDATPFCPECADGPDQPEVVDRRNFIRVVGGSTVGMLAAGGLAPAVLADGARFTTATPATRVRKPAEDLVRAGEVFFSQTRVPLQKVLPHAHLLGALTREDERDPRHHSLAFLARPALPRGAAGYGSA